MMASATSQNLERNSTDSFLLQNDVSSKRYSVARPAEVQHQPSGKVQQCTLFWENLSICEAFESCQAFPCNR